MLTAFLYGLGTAVPLAIGAAIGLHWTLPRAVLAGLMAFGAGTMIAAVSSELFEPAFEHAGPVIAGLALFAGAGVYVVANHLIENRLGPAAIGWALMLGTVLDGIPENTALGVSLTTGGGLVLLVAVAVGNVPEAVSGAALMRQNHGFSQTRALTMWSATAATGRYSGSFTSMRMRTWLGRSTLPWRRGRKAEIGVSAMSWDEIGRIGPPTERL